MSKNFIKNAEKTTISKEIIIEHDLKVLNETDQPTFIGHITKYGTHIDVTAATANIAGKLNSWHISDEVTLSDHKLIRFKAENQHKVEINRPWAFKRCNWTEFKSLMHNKSWKCPGKWTIHTIENEVSNLQNDINCSLNLSCPRSQGLGIPPKKTSRTNNWWNSKCEKAREKSMRLRKELQTWKYERYKLDKKYPD